MGETARGQARPTCSGRQSRLHRAPTSPSRARSPSTRGLGWSWASGARAMSTRKSEPPRLRPRESAALLPTVCVFCLFAQQEKNVIHEMIGNRWTMEVQKEGKIVYSLYLAFLLLY